MASYPLYYLKKLMGVVPPDENVSRKSDHMVRLAAEANCKLDGRTLEAMSINDLREYKESLAETSTCTFELELMVDACIQRKESRMNGSPIQGERLAKVG